MHYPRGDECTWQTVPKSMEAIMPEIISAELRRALKAAGITIVEKGVQIVPAKSLVVSLAECEATGAIKYHAPHRVVALVDGEEKCPSIGDGLYAVFDTIAHHWDGATGKITFGFFEVTEFGSLRETSESTGVGVFTDERMKEAVQVVD
ncbi:MAG: hypothetical protein Q7S01_01075 [bacterium]|nr:hypothetical protein [bacterium]